MPTRLPRRLAAVPLLAAVLALPACGSGGTTADPVATTAPAPTAPAGVTATTPAPTVVALDKTFWYGGFEVALTQAEWLQRADGATVSLSLRLANLRDESARLDQHDVSLTVGGNTVRSQLNDLPEVPGAAKNDGAVSFYVTGPFALEGATLTWGGPDSNQAVVPLGGAEPTTYEPKVATAAGGLATKQGKAVLKAGVLDASWARGEKGKYVLRVPMAFTYLGTAAGGYYLAPDQFTLTLPNGNAVPAAPIAPGDLVAEAAPPGRAVDKALAFKVAEPGDGPFTLTFKDSTGGTAKVTVTVA